MSSKKRDSRQSAFDFDDEPVESIQLAVSPPVWQEVPQALFLSWSHARQLSYCARRDEDSAQQTGNEDERQFYLQRAQDYRSQM